jgi:hypothetical protein
MKKGVSCEFRLSPATPHFETWVPSAGIPKIELSEREKTSCNVWRTPSVSELLRLWNTTLCKWGCKLVRLSYLFTRCRSKIFYSAGGLQQMQSTAPAKG